MAEGGRGQEEEEEERQWQETQQPRPQQEPRGVVEDEEEDRQWQETQQPRPQQEPRGVVEVGLEVEDPDFDLERAVCSHGLFMMAPNRWDPGTRIFQRPLRLHSAASSALHVFVRISHPLPRPSPLRISVVGVDDLSFPHQESLLEQIRRMLRINKDDDRAVKEFHRLHPVAKERGFGRVFRSPTLFEDMVKCILLCNCQWSRTLSMARALCELQSELKHGGSTVHDLQPRTPEKKETRRKKPRREDEAPSSVQTSKGLRSNLLIERNSHEILESRGDFPSPEELAGLDEDFLARRCVLGYRAKRIRLLAQTIAEKKIQLNELEEACDVSDPSSYDLLNERLSCLHGFGPFTRANVLMCMGFYHKIPSDSETIRHLKQVHSLSCTSIRMVDKHVDDIYGEFAPFQFLAYWSELWDYYEQKFGKMSEMVPSDYQRITANNMKYQGKLTGKE